MLTPSQPVSSTGMYEVVSDADGAYEFVCRSAPVYASSWQAGIVLKKDGVITAATLYHEYNGSNLFIHAAGTPGTNWLTREMLYWTFHYPFVQLGCRRVTAWVEANNIRSRRFTEKIGWTREARLTAAGRDGVDVLLYKMMREDCRYV